MAEIIYRDGVNLHGTPLWMDASAPRRFCFVSSGHARRLAGHEQVLATPPTVRFFRARLGQGNALITPYNRPFTLGQLRLELLPAGSMLGAAQLLIDADDERIVYTGWLGPVSGIDSAERPQIRRCDRLVLNTHAEMTATASERESGRRRLLDRIGVLLDEGRLPVVLCEPLGMAQEIVSWCRRRRWRVRGHRSIAAFTHEYRRFGREVGASPELRRWPKEDHGPVDADVILFPSLLGHSPILGRLPDRHIIATWPGDPPEKRDDSVEHIAHVTCHASLEDLVVYCRCARPQEVVVVGPWSTELAASLRPMGVSVHELHMPVQKSLFEADALPDNASSSG